MYSTEGEHEIAPRQVRARPRHAFEIRQRIQREIYFARRSAIFEAIDVFEKFTREMFGVDELVKGQPRVNAGRNEIRINLAAIVQHYAFSLAGP